MLPASYKRTEDAFYYLLGEGKGGGGRGGGGGGAEKLNVQFYFQPPPHFFISLCRRCKGLYRKTPPTG